MRRRPRARLGHRARAVSQLAGICLLALSSCSAVPVGPGAGRPVGAAVRAATAGRPSVELTAWGRRPPGSLPVAPAAGPAAPVADPTVLEAPAIGLRTELVPLGLDPGGALQVPVDPSMAGFYVGGPRPGATGPAVLVGHVDSTEGAGVFVGLHALGAGDLVQVGRGDGTTAVFAVDRVEVHGKDAFPTQRVYGPTSGPELRLITCGGPFDRRARRYESNVVVYASLVPDA